MYKLYSGRVAKLSGFRPFLQRDKFKKNPKDTWLQPYRYVSMDSIIQTYKRYMATAGAETRKDQSNA